MNLTAGLVENWKCWIEVEEYRVPTKTNQSKCINRHFVFVFSFVHLQICAFEKKTWGENALKKLPFFYPQQNFDYVKNSKTQQTANEDAKKKLKN